MNIAVRSPNWIGDCIMALPAIRAVQDHFPQAALTLVTREYLADVYKNIREIEKIVTIPDKIDFSNIFKTAKKLKELAFDAGILFTNSFNSALLFKLAGIKQLVGYSKDCRGFLLNQRVRFPRNEKHHIYFYLDLVEAFTREKIGKEYPDELSISAEEREQAARLLAKSGLDLSTPLVGIAPSAAYGSAKQWLPGRFAELILKIRQEKRDCQVVLFGSQKERVKIAEITAGLSAVTGVYNLAGRLSLREAIAAISLCKLFISNDSGLLHVASSLKVPLVAIFGPTLPHKTAPLYEKAVTLHHPVDCAPCKYRDCPIDHRCMTAVTVDEVYEAVINNI